MSSLPPRHRLLKVTSLRTLLNSKGLEYDDVGSICLPNYPNVPQLVYRTTLSRAQVILYNFFGESADARLWQHLANTDGSLKDPKHVPLIYEVSHTVILWDLEE